MAVSRRAEETNPFFVEDDDHNWSFKNTTRNQFDDEDTTLEQLIARKEESERRQLESLNRSLVVVHETEDIGVKTAEELLHQGEQLEKTEKNLDSINSMTKVTQRHLNNIKSVFGGIKNWFQKSETPPLSSREEVQHSRLRDTLTEGVTVGDGSNTKSTFGGKFQTSHPHKAARLYNESDEEDDDEFRKMGTSSTQNAMDSRFSMLSDGLHRLKGLGEGMHEELIRQDHQISRITEKAEKADDVLKDQTKQTRALLK